MSLPNEFILLVVYNLRYKATVMKDETPHTIPRSLDIDPYFRIKNLLKTC